MHEFQAMVGEVGLKQRFWMNAREIRYEFRVKNGLINLVSPFQTYRL